MISIRSSLLPTYLDCPRRAAAQQWPDTVASSGHKLRRQNKNVLALIGTGTHSGAQYQMICKKDGEVLTDGLCSRSVEAGICKYREEAQDGVDYDDTTRNQNAAETQITRLTKLYYFEVAPEINPYWIEKQMEVIFGEWRVSGQLDILTQKTEHTFGLRDTKTGAKIKLHQAQLGNYAMLASRELKKINSKYSIADCGIDFLHRAALNKPVSHKYLGYNLRTAERLALETLRRIKYDYTNFIEAGDPWCFMVNTNSMLCSPKYCRAFGTDWCEVTQ